MAIVPRVMSGKCASGVNLDKGKLVHAVGSGEMSDMNVKTLLDRLASTHEEIGALKVQLATARQRLAQQEASAISPRSVEALLEAMGRRDKISAIKEVWAMTGLCLKEAKELVERHLPAS